MLSYAERAKKAQNIRSPIDNTVHAVSVSMSASSPFSSNVSSTSSTGSSAVNSAAISSSSTDVDAADTTAPTTSNSSVILESDDEQKEQQKEIQEERAAVRRPAVNVWQMRMAESKQPGVKGDPSTPKFSPAKAEDDPFIVKMRTTRSPWPGKPEKRNSLDLRDSNAWPEVGKTKGKGKSSEEEGKLFKHLFIRVTLMRFRKRKPGFKPFEIDQGST